MKHRHQWRILFFLSLLYGSEIIASFPAPPPLDAAHADAALTWIDQTVSRKTQNKEVWSTLAVALRDDETPVKIRERAAWALGQLDAKPYAKDLVNALDDKGLLVRSAALDGLFHMRAPEGLPAVIDLASNDPVLIIRERSVVYLGFLSSDKAIKALVQLSSDPREEIRGAAALSMAATQSKKNDFSQALKEMTADPSPYVQDRAKVGLDITARNRKAMLSHLGAASQDIRLFTALYFHWHGMSTDRSAIKSAAANEPNDEVRYELGLAEKAIKKRAQASAKKQRSTPKKTKASHPSKIK